MLEAIYTGESQSLLSGGRDRQTRYLDNLDLTLALDMDSLVGARGLTLFAYGLYNNGVSFSGDVGDVQVSSNIETGVRAVRLYEAWAEQQLFGERASIRFGLYDLNSEFDVLEVANLFLNASHGIGPDIAQSGINGPSIFPSTSLAARLSVSPVEGLILRLAVLDGVPGDPDRPRRTTVRLSGEDGVLLIGEADYQRGDWRIIAGGWGYTAQAVDLVASEAAGEEVGGPGGNRGGYLRGEWTMWRDPARQGRTLSGFARVGFADRRYNEFSRFYGVGLVATGLSAARPDDQLGISVARAVAGQPARTVATVSGSEIEHAETSLELTWRAPITDWLTLQPDLQYIINPGLDPLASNAVTFGFRFELAWSN